VSNQSPQITTPIVKWAGGKRRLAREIISHFPREFNTYIEPFFGGGAVFLQLNPSEANISDANAGLINLYKHVKDHRVQLERSLTRLEREYNSLMPTDQEALYYKIRERFNSEDRSGLRKARDFVFLNKTGFNGMYRESKAGKMNIPFGKKASVRLFSKKNFLQVSCMLKNKKIDVADYQDAVSRAKSGDLIYLDPPYLPVSSTSSFTAYHSLDFKLEQQNELASIIKELDSRGVFIVLSNSFHGDIADLYKNDFPNFEIFEIQAARSIGASAASRGKTLEYLITNVKAQSKMV
jgi:DNA adenine methylase